MKKFARLFICICAIGLIFSSLSVGAWMPDKWFYVDIDEQSIPEDTAYIDFLMPIPTEDEAYVDFNEANGELYGISQDSEIVTYCEDGFVSYTFHVSDAYSILEPYYIAELVLANELYNENKDLFEGLDFQYDDWTEDAHITVKLGSDTEEKLRNIAETLQIEVNFYHDSTLTTEYNLPDFAINGVDVDRNAKFDYEYCKENFKFAKMAYLDRDGKIIAVSNKVRVDPFKIGAVQLNLELSGESFTCDPTTGPPIYLLPLFIIIPILFFGGLLFLLIICLKDYFSARKNSI